MFKFLKKKPLSTFEKLVSAAYGENPPRPQRANLDMAIDLAHSSLLMGSIEKSEIATIAQGLFEGKMPYSTHDLAIATSLNFFMRPELREDLIAAQLMARLTALEWFKEGKVVPILFKSFEETLYKKFK